MTWPTDDLSTDHFDAASDAPAAARPVLKRLIEIVKALIGARASADGVCELDANAKVPAANLPAISPPDATTAVKGIVKLATPAETRTGNRGDLATHPQGVKSAIDTAIDAIDLPAPGVTTVTVNNTTSKSGSGDTVKSVTTTLSGSISGTRLTLTLNTHTVRGDAGAGGSG